MILFAQLANLILAMVWYVVIRGFGADEHSALLGILVMQMACLLGTQGVVYAMLYAHFHRLYPSAKTHWGMFKI